MTVAPNYVETNKCRSAVQNLILWSYVAKCLNSLLTLSQFIIAAMLIVHGMLQYCKGNLYYVAATAHKTVTPLVHRLSAL